MLDPVGGIGGEIAGSLNPDRALDQREHGLRVIEGFSPHVEDVIVKRNVCPERDLKNDFNGTRATVERCPDAVEVESDEETTLLGGHRDRCRDSGASAIAEGTYVLL